MYAFEYLVLRMWKLLTILQWAVTNFTRSVVTLPEI